MNQDAAGGRDVWMVLAGVGASGAAIRLQVRAGEGVHGNALRRVDVVSGSAELQESAARGTRLAYDILFREKLVNRQTSVSFSASVDLANVHGNSGDLAFALAYAFNQLHHRPVDGTAITSVPGLAVTGALAGDGAVLSVEGLAEKFAWALQVLPSGGIFLFPAVNEGDLPPGSRQTAMDRGIRMAPVYRIQEALESIGVPITRTWLECPFRGLEPFEFRHASIFFGREREVEEVRALLERRGAEKAGGVLVTGPSGSGKSSLVFAGVLPALRALAAAGGLVVDLRWARFRRRDVEPDADVERESRNLFAGLHAAWFHGDAGSLPVGTRGSIPTGTRDAAEFQKWLQAQVVDSAQTRFVLVLDQMEEWLQGPLQRETVDRLGQVVSGLASSGVWVIGMITSGAYTLLRDYPSMDAVFGVEGVYALDNPRGAAELEAVIREPARVAGLRFEPGLDAEIFASANHGGHDVLPLLELLLTELYERRDRQYGELRFSDFRDVGGLEGIVSTRAEAAFDRCELEEQALVPHMLWKLLTAGEIHADDYPPQGPMRALIGAFKERRLLVEDGSFRPAHEALFRHWARALKQQAHDESDIRLWQDLVRESGQWTRGARALIPSGPQLESASSLYERRASDWTRGDAITLEYIRASLRQRRVRRGLIAGVLGVPAIIASGLGVRFGFRYVERLHLVRINFDDMALPSSEDYVPAAAELRHFGISVTAEQPGDALLIIKSAAALYNGQAVDTTQSRHCLTQRQTTLPVAPVSYTLAFQRPVNAVRLQRAPLWAATASGVTHPSWSALARDQTGRTVATVHEDLIGAFSKGTSEPDVPARWYELSAPSGAPIHGVEVVSDYRDASGRPFAGFQAVLLQEIQLVI